MVFANWLSVLLIWFDFLLYHLLDCVVWEFTRWVNHTLPNTNAFIMEDFTFLVHEEEHRECKSLYIRVQTAEILT
jgi:hypothetical protein